MSPGKWFRRWLASRRARVTGPTCKHCRVIYRPGYMINWRKHHTGDL